MTVTKARYGWARTGRPVAYPDFEELLDDDPEFGEWLDSLDDDFDPDEFDPEDALRREEAQWEREEVAS